MKKLFLALCAALLAFTACDNEPKEFVWKDLSITYPHNYKISDVIEDDDMYRFTLSKDDDNFLIVRFEYLGSELLADFSDEEIRSIVYEEAHELYMSDVENEDMEVDQEGLTVIKSPAGSRPGVVFMYSGTHFGDPFKGRVSVTILDDYDVSIMAEAMDDASLKEITDIITSVVKK